MPVHVDTTAELTLTAGTGTLTLAGPTLGHRSFAQALGATAEVYYGIAHLASGAKETGIGRYVASNNTLERLQVLSSSNANGLVAFPAGEKVVFSTLPADVSLRATARRATDVALEVRAAGGQAAPLMTVSDAAGVDRVRVSQHGALELLRTGNVPQLLMEQQVAGRAGIYSALLTTGPNRFRDRPGIRIRLSGAAGGAGVLQVSHEDAGFLVIDPSFRSIGADGDFVVHDYTRETGASEVGRFTAGSAADTNQTVITRVKGDARYATASSRRFKEDIQPLVATEADLEPVSFVYGGELPEDDPRRTGGRELGFIAEDVAMIAPEAVVWEDPDTVPEGQQPRPVGIKPVPLIAMLWARLQAVEAKIVELSNG